jgi:putative membrane protein
LSSADNAQLGGLKTELLIAWVFALLVVIAWVIGFLVVIGSFAAAAAVTSGVGGGGIFGGAGLIIGVFLLILALPSILVVRRVGKMRSAAKRGDLQTLKGLNSVGWSIVALLFTGLIPGILLLIAHGPISSLSTPAAA